MINVSNEFNSVVNGQNRTFYGGAEITLFDGTVLNLDNSQIIGLKIDDATSQSGQFTIGSAIINKLTLSINNLYDEFSDYDFTGAIIRPSVGLQLSETIETLSKGVFTADDPQVRSSVIALTALDNMAKFDKPFSGVTQIFPCTALTLLNSVCTYCGVVLATTTFDKYDYIVQSRPLDNAVNCREIVSWIAQLGGNFARCNISGSLELKWYDFDVFENETRIDGGSFDNDTPYSSGDSVDGGTFAFNDGDAVDGGTFINQQRYHHIYKLSSSPTISTDDVVITGIQVTDNTESSNTAFFGSTGYVISISGNKLIQSQSDAQIIANTVGAKIVGMRFRPCSFTAISDPTREAGDVAYLTDRKHNTYQILLSSVSFSIGQSDRISCDAESATRNSATRYAVDVKAIIDARNYTEKKLTAYDIVMQQFNNLISHSFGVYKSEVTLDDGSTIYYMHDKPTLAESQNIWKQTATTFSVSNDGGQTYNAGFDSEGNAVFNVLNAIGINAQWIKTGTLEGIEIIAQTGKIARMTLDSDGLFMGNESDKYFRIKNGDAIFHVFDGRIYIESPNGWKVDGTDYHIAGNDGLIENRIENENRLYRVALDTNNDQIDISIVNKITDEYEHSKVLINGIPVIERINSMSQSITALQQQNISQQSQIDYILSVL